MEVQMFTEYFQNLFPAQTYSRRRFSPSYVDPLPIEDRTESRDYRAHRVSRTSVIAATTADRCGRC